MKTHPIIFSTSMVQAILEGRKTMTRRVVKGFPEGLPDEIAKIFHDGNEWYFGNKDKNCWLLSKTCPYGQPGDILWVRESFIDAGVHNENRFRYKADEFKSIAEILYWKPSIHMPKYACRIWLQIVNIHVERLQAITQPDILAEGLLKNSLNNPTPADFYGLWDSIHGKTIANKKQRTTNWNSNPFVWVIEFKKVTKPENF